MSTYAEYLAKARKQKINPDLLAPKDCQLPVSARPRKDKYQRPPLDIGSKRKKSPIQHEN